MKISCDIIRDLLPLYAEDLTSQASNDMVDEHLKDCEGCRDCLSDLRRPAQRPQEVSVHSLNRIKKRIQKRRILTALLAVLILVSLYVNVETVLDSYVYLTADQALEAQVSRKDGTFTVYFDSCVSGIGSTIRDEEPNNMGIIAQTRLRNILFPKTNYGKTTTILDEEDNFFTHSGVDPQKTNVWYYSYKDGKPASLLWNAGAEHPDPEFSFEEHINYRIAYYCVASAILSVVLAVLARKKQKGRAGKWLRMVSLFLGCSCVAVLCESGGQFVDFGIGIPTKIIDSVTPFIPMFLTGLCAFSLYDMKEQELLSEEEIQNMEDQHTIRNRKILNVLTPILAAVTLYMCVATVGDAMIYLTPEEAAIRMTVQEDGSVKTEESRLVSMNAQFGGDDAVGLLYGGQIKYVLPYRMGWKPLDLNGTWGTMPKETAEQQPSYWYLNPKDGTADVLVWDNGTEKPTEPIVKRNNSPAYYTLVTCAAFLTFLALTVALPKQRTYLRYGTLLFGSLFVGYVLASGGEFYKFQGIYTITNKFDGSLFAAVPMFLTGTSAFLLHDLKKHSTP